MLDDGLEIRATGHDYTLNIAQIIANKVLNGQLSNSLNVRQPLLLPQSSESVCGLTTSSMLLRQFDSNLLQDGSDISLEGGKKGATTINDNKAEFLIVLQEISQQIGLESILAVIFEGLAWSEWFKVPSDPLL